MCCLINERATKKLRKRTRAFVGWKVVYKTRQTYCTSTLFRKGWNHAYSSNGRVLVSERYDPQRPQGIHFYLKMPSLKLFVWDAVVVPVTVFPEDVIACEAKHLVYDDTCGPQAVACKVHVDMEEWKEAGCVWSRNRSR